MAKLEGKVAIITGGASGIGEATARLFVENGARVVIADIQDEMGIQLANELGIDVAAYKHCDVSQECDVESLVTFALEKWGKLDIMFSNAGIVGSKTLTQEVATMDMADFDQVMSVNARGMALGVKHVSKAMLHANTRGSIICTASTASVSARYSYGNLSLSLFVTRARVAVALECSVSLAPIRPSSRSAPSSRSLPALCAHPLSLPHQALCASYGRSLLAALLLPHLTQLTICSGSNTWLHPFESLLAHYTKYYTTSQLQLLRIWSAMAREQSSMFAMAGG